MRKIHLSVILLLILTASKAQQAPSSINRPRLKLKSYSIGYRIFELNTAVGEPRTLVPLMKNPVAYRNFINTLQHNSITGNGGYGAFHNVFINAEVVKNSPESRFWKKHAVQSGVFISNRLVSEGSTLENRHVSPDTTFYYDRYRLKQHLQFLGLNAGLNRRSRLSNKLQFVVGLHLQGAVAVVHSYQHHLDSSTFKSGRGWQSNITQLADAKGTCFLQWQAFVPLGLEIAVYKRQIFIRADFNAGVVGRSYRTNGLRFQESHGGGLWVICHPY